VLNVPSLHGLVKLQEKTVGDAQLGRRFMCRSCRLCKMKATISYRDMLSHGANGPHEAIMRKFMLLDLPSQLRSYHPSPPQGWLAFKPGGQATLPLELRETSF
jgi:hypothetical protein